MALQAVLMHVWTLVRNEVAEQIHFASVVAQPVAPMALRAQVTWTMELIMPSLLGFSAEGHIQRKMGA